MLSPWAKRYRRASKCCACNPARPSLSGCIHLVKQRSDSCSTSAQGGTAVSAAAVAAKLKVALSPNGCSANRCLMPIGSSISLLMLVSSSCNKPQGCKRLEQCSASRHAIHLGLQVLNGSKTGHQTPTSRFHCRYEEGYVTVACTLEGVKAFTAIGWGAAL